MGLTMTTQNVTLHLPEVLAERVKRAANVLQRPWEEVIVSVLAAALPDVEDAPVDMRAELARMTWLGDQELWAIANSSMAEEQQQQMRHLTGLQVERPLTQEEQDALDALRQEYGRVTLRKARAYALLSLRGGRPLLADG
jgi:hypothetical protein